MRSCREAAARITVRAALITLVLPVALAAQEPGTPADTIRLRFGWQPNTAASIEARTFRESVAEEVDTVVGMAKYRLQVTGRPDGLLLSYSDFDLGPAGTGLAGAITAMMQQQVASLVPNIVVNPDGDFVEIDDLPALHARMDTIMGRLLGASDSTGELRARIAGMLSEDALSAVSEQEWNALVAMWIDADLALGEWYQFEDVGAIPILPGATIPMVNEFSVLERVSCADYGPGSDCVRIQLLSYPDPDVLAKLLGDLVDRMAGDQAPALAFEELDIENEVLLVTDPGTLRPYRADITKSIAGAVTQDGAKSTFSRYDVRSYTYHWDR